MKIPFKPFTPDIENLYKVVRREKTDRPVLFEFIIDLELCREAAQQDTQPEQGSLDYYMMILEVIHSNG